MPCTKNLVLKLAFFFLASHDGYFTHLLLFRQFDVRRGGFNASMLRGISAVLDIIDQYDVIHKACFDTFLSILALHCSSNVDWTSYVDAEYPFLSYSFCDWGGFDFRSIAGC